MTEVAEWEDIGEVEFANLEPQQIELGERAREKYEDLDILAESIREKGVIQPLAVQRTEEDPDKYRLLAGGRRFSAMVFGKIKPIPVRIFPEDLSDLDRKEIELFENVHRMDLTWQEQSKLTEAIDEIKRIQSGVLTVRGSSEGHSQSDTAKMIGKTQAAVSQDIALAKALDAHPEIADAKNASEARRMLKKIQRQTEARQAAAAFDADREEEGEDQALQGLCNSYYVGDFFSLSEDIPENSVSFIEIDPPYGIELDQIKKTSAENIGGYTEIPIEEYPEFLLKLFTESHRLLVGSGWMICWFGFQWYQTVIDTMTATGFSPCPVPAFWVKPIQGQTHQPEQRLGSVVEGFIYARKGTPILRKPGRSNSFVYAPPPPGSKIHPTERPIEMMEDIIETFCVPGGTFCVPFLGSGNTLLAGFNKGFRGWGTDLDAEDEYKNAFIQRVQNRKQDKYTSYVE